MGGIHRRRGGSPSQAWDGLEHLDDRTCGRPSNLLSLYWLRTSPTYSTDLSWQVYEMVFENTPDPGWPCHPLMSYCLWLCLISDIMMICMDFGPYDAFPSSDVSKMVNQQNSWNLLVISTYLIYLEWNLSMLAVDLCILWSPTIYGRVSTSNLFNRNSILSYSCAKSFIATKPI
jgi:hypothetical protein